MGDRSSSGSDREYHLGLRLDPVLLVLRQLQDGVTPLLRGLAIEVAPSSVSHSRQLGASDAWVKKIETANPARRQLYFVRHNECGSETSRVLKDLDLILSMNGRPASSVSDFEVGLDWKDKVDVTLVRDKVEMELSVPTSILDGECTKKIVFWAGAMLHGMVFFIAHTRCSTHKM
jgi:hypothetical protein